MKINFTIKADLINQEEKKYLKGKLHADDASLETKLNEIAKAAFHEYITMLKGEGVPANVGELHERRFNSLMKYYFKTKIPDENEVKLIFKIPKGKAKKILETCSNNVSMEAMRLELIKSILADAEDKGTYFEFVIPQDFIVDELKNKVETDGKKLEQISAVKNATKKYQCHTDTYNFLKGKYGIE